MKKKIFGGIAVLAIAAVAVFNVNLNSQSDKLSTVSLANVEALAGFNENGNEDNSFWDWLDQGLTKDEYAVSVVCTTI